ncbi:MAG: chromophore lyase CpcT/CpeT [Polyangiaceae bacterium]|nr:chromophore lyase CpcT/CpeT [Polyangiaceae bacterium]
MRTFLALVLTALTVTACDGGNETTQGGGGQGGGSGGTGGMAGSGGTTTMPPKETAGDKLYRYLTGQFDTKNQAKGDPNNYLPINLLTCPIDIPELGTRVLHVEQALIQSGEIQNPYRQRVYVVTDGADPETQAVSHVWEFNAPTKFTGFCAGTGEKATPTDLTERDGCRVELTWMTDHFEGSTPGKECLSDFQGATYATSKVSVFDNRIESWDQGWDANDMQVWGAVKGPYIFDRLTPLPEPPQ